ncbi:glycoside hydrolase family 30 protein [Algibacter lectus]|uniref:glycoside hydrolase family 30 protein n=1 Tax=Algibacter lectus TaxID=221126 RepID=UPI0026E9AA5B|nr:hypothetical protein [Algibacter lectus]MDO7137583.1 hypothetical protein [Algibacter lectus]
MKKFTTLLLCLLSIVTAWSQNSIEVHAIKLSGDIPNGEIIVNKSVGKDVKMTVNRKNKIKLYPNIEFQTLEGFGGAFNEIGGEALMSLPSALKDQVIKNLFSLNQGAALVFNRTAVGASDFGINAYSYAEKADDYKMKHFSIEREETTVIPYLQKAFKANPDLKLFASPWSPPAWMKYSGLMDRGEEFPEKNQLKDEAKIYKAYALYFSKYIQAYAEKGITVDRLIIQNENDANTKYPSNDMSVAQMNKLVKSYLRPQFEKDNIDTEIWAGTFRSYGRLDVLEIAASEDYRNLYDGIGIQYTSGIYIQQTKDVFPEVNLMHTEGNCDDGKNNWKQASNRLREIANYINRGVPNYCYWNMILNETTESGWDWKQNSLINIDRNTKQVTYNPDYAVIGFMSQYLVPGAKRIANFSRADLISIKHQGKVYVLLQNSKDEAQIYECQIENGEGKTVEIPSNSLAVVILNI